MLEFIEVSGNKAKELLEAGYYLTLSTHNVRDFGYTFYRLNDGNLESNYIMKQSGYWKKETLFENFFSKRFIAYKELPLPKWPFKVGDIIAYTTTPSTKPLLLKVIDTALLLQNSNEYELVGPSAEYLVTSELADGSVLEYVRLKNLRLATENEVKEFKLEKVRHHEEALKKQEKEALKVMTLMCFCGNSITFEVVESYKDRLYSMGGALATYGDSFEVQNKTTYDYNRLKCHDCGRKFFFN